MRGGVLQGLALSVAALVLLDLALAATILRDGVVRGLRLPPFGLLFTEQQERALGSSDWRYSAFDAELGWSYVPSGVARDGFYRANDQGFRANRSYALAKPRGSTRIAAFGDSFTHADDVSNEQMWTNRMERSQPGLEVLNFGVSGYGPDQALLRYRRDGAPFRPDIVLIGLMVENILRTVSVYRPAYNPDSEIPLTKPRFRIGADGDLELVPNPARSLAELRRMIHSGELVGLLLGSDYWVRSASLAYRDSPLFLSSLFRIAYAAWLHRDRNIGSYYADPESEPFRVTFGLLIRFAEEARRNGARPLVLVFPFKPNLRERLEGGPAYWESLTERLEAAGVEVLDLTPPLLELARRGGLDVVFDGRVHYGPTGNAFVAEAVLRRCLP